MSSLVRRIQRQTSPSTRRIVVRNQFTGEVLSDEPAPPRAKFYQGRGKHVGYTNPRDRARLAREAREAKRAAA